MDEFGEWARTVAVPLGSLGALAPFTAGADLVFLGELNHFVHEKAQFRLAMLRPLVRDGWDALAEELGWSDGWRVQSYLATGDEARLARLATFGYEGDLRTDRSDRMGGVLKGSAEAFPVALFRAEQTRFYRALRSLSPRAYRGIDIDALPGGAYQDVGPLLPPGLRSRLARVPGESALEEAGRLRRFVSEHALSGEAAAALAALADSLEYVAKAYAAADYEALRPGMAFREACMKRRAVAALETMPRGSRGMAVMAHALHLAKDDRLFPKGIGGVGPGGGLTTSLGHHLVQERGLTAFSVWMVYGEGEDSQPFPDLPRTANFPATSLNRRLAVFDEPVFIPLASAPARLLERPVAVGQMYDSLVETQLGGQVDAICFFPRVGPLRA